MIIRICTGRKLIIFTSKADTVGCFFRAEGPAVLYKGFQEQGQRTQVDGFPVTCAPRAAALEPPKEEDFEHLPPAQPGVVLIVPYPVEVAGCQLGRKDHAPHGAGAVRRRKAGRCGGLPVVDDLFRAR